MHARASLDKLAESLRGLTPNTQALTALFTFLGLFTAQATLMHLKMPVVAVVYAVSLFALVSLVMVRARFDAGTIVIVLGALWLYLGYFGYTDYGERNYDGGEQLRYVEWMVEHRFHRPPASQCLICHHPPLYYGLGAVFYIVFKVTKIGPPIAGVQIYSLLCHLVFVLYGVATARRLLKTQRELHLATALLCFWPYTVENTVRLHNDTLATTFMGVGAFYVIRWAQERRGVDLYLATMVTGLGLLTKSSAYVTAGATFGLLFLYFWRTSDKVRYVRRAIVAGFILLAALFLNSLGKENTTSKVTTGSSIFTPGSYACRRILGNACDIHQGQWVENKPKNYVWLDLKTFLDEPYALAERDGSGRAYFWNHLLKSSLFGTHNTTPDRETAYELNRYVAYALNVLMLGMLVYMVISTVVFARRRAFKWFLPTIVLLASCIAFMMAFRIIIPAPHHTDYRHIASTVVLVAAVYAAAAGRARLTAPWWETIGRALAIPFVALSIFYFLPKHDLVIRLTTHVVKRDLAKYSKIVPEGTQWDLPTNLLIEENHIVEFETPSHPTVRELDTSLDNNDKYEFTLIGDTTRVVYLGPKPDKKGLMRYVEKIDPPVANVHTIRVKPISGDLAYSMGHLVVR